MNFRRSLKLLPIIIFSLILISCQAISGSGTAMSDTRAIDGVDHIELNLVGELLITLGDSDSMTIEGDDNIVPNIETKVSGSKLTIEYDTNNVRLDPEVDLVYRITVTDLSKVVLNGAGDIELNGLRSDFELSVNGAGDITANGAIENLSVDLNGAGAFEGAELTTATTDVAINGAGSARVHATKLLRAEINGVGDINYSGNPEVDRSINGAGSIEAVNGR